MEKVLLRKKRPNKVMLLVVFESRKGAAPQTQRADRANTVQVIDNLFATRAFLEKRACRVERFWRNIACLKTFRFRDHACKQQGGDFFIDQIGIQSGE